MAEDTGKRSKKRWFGPALIGFAIFAVTMFAVSTVLMSKWTTLAAATAQEAQQSFEDVRARFGATEPYVAIDADGNVRVTRELDLEQTTKLRTLHLMAYEPERAQLVDVAFPYWFVALKLSDSMNLGTMTTVLARDWDHLDLRVTEEELEALGPALVLDHALENGARIMLWTE